MLKVKKITYGSIPKNNELTKLTAEIKQAFQKIEEEKNKKTRQLMIMQNYSINKKRIPKVSVRKRFIKDIMMMKMMI